MAAPVNDQVLVASRFVELPGSPCQHDGANAPFRAPDPACHHPPADAQPGGADSGTRLWPRANGPGHLAV